MYTRKQALALAKQLRTCPPLKVKNDPGFAEQVKNHLAVCPFCSTVLKDEKEAFELFSDRFAAGLPRGLDCPPPVPGQVRVLDPGLACWRDNCFYTPPEVVVLQVDPDTDCVLAAQIWRDLTLAGPGDLILPQKMCKEMSGLFIETWNIYSLAKDFLGPCLCTLDREVADSVLEMDRCPDYLPRWAIKTMPLQPDDPRIYFREIELETGYTFSAMAGRQLMAKTGTPVIPISLDALKKELEEKVTGISWDWTPQNIEECMAVLRFPDHLLPWAAAVDDEPVLTAAYFSFNRAGMQDVRPVECRILHTADTRTSWSVSGIIRDLPADIPEDAFQCYIKDSKSKILMACNWHWDKNTEQFIAVFERPLAPSEKLALFIVHYEE